jgi:hypothetical protein
VPAAPQELRAIAQEVRPVVEEMPAVSIASPIAAENDSAAISVATSETETSPPLAAPASDAEVAQWSSKVRASGGLGSGLRTTPSTASAWPLVLRELMEVVGEPRDLGAAVALVEEIDALDEVASDERLDERWTRLPKHVQQTWLAALAARTRSVKEQPNLSPDQKARVKTILGRYPAWAKAYMPGHVNGLQVRHPPLHESWDADARHAWGQLDDFLGEELGERQAGAPTKKKAKRTASDDDAPDIDPSWRLFPFVRGRDAVTVGGDPREPSREKLERALDLASLEWPAIEGPRKVESLAESIRRGSYGLVLVVQTLVAHKQANAIVEAAKDADVPWALVEGYGLSAVTRGLERYLGGPRSGAADG